jgi:hypothetical protein
MTRPAVASFVAGLAIAVGSTAAVAQTPPTPSSCAALAAAKTKTYGFRPTLLNDKEQEAKSAEMDRFWDLVKAAGPEGVTCMTTFIAGEQTDKWFLFDAASLLAMLDPSGRSDTTIVEALARTDLAEMDPAAFVRLAVIVSTRGGDIGPAAHNYMTAPRVTAFLPIHGGFRLDRTSGAMLMYGSMASDLADKYLAIEVASTNAETRNAAAIVWSMNLTEASFRGLAALGEMTDFSTDARAQVRGVRRFIQAPPLPAAKFTREQVLERIARWPDEDSSTDFAMAFVSTLTAADLQTVRDARRRLVTGVSDEAIFAYDGASRMLMMLINVLDAYKEYRVR